MNRGYVKVWRKIEDSGLIQLPNTLALFMHLLLNATHKDRKVGTSTGVIELKRGQYISGRIELAARLKQTEQQIRTSLKRLQDLGIVTSTATNRFSIYTIENYSKYQDEQPADNQQNDQQITSKQPADNQQITTKQELNNLNIEEVKNKSTKKTFVLPDWINAKHWDAWHSCPKRKRASTEQKELAVAKLAEWRDQGIDYNKALENAAIGGWQGLFEPQSLAPRGQQQPYKTKAERIAENNDRAFAEFLNDSQEKTIEGEVIHD